MRRNNAIVTDRVVIEKMAAKISVIYVSIKIPEDTQQIIRQLSKLGTN